MNRRDFLSLAIKGAALVALPSPKGASLKLYGDGVHDDSEALEALFNGPPVDATKGLIRRLSGGCVMLCNGTFRLTKPVRLPVDFNIALGEGCTLALDPEAERRLIYDID